MKKHILLLIVGLGFLLPTLEAQQMANSIIQISRGNIFNPGRTTTGDLNQLFIAYQNRTILASELASNAEFVQFLGKPVGKKKAFCWGFKVINDQEHTEGRLLISPQISARVFQNDHSYLSVGISAGLLNWTSNYQTAPQYTPEDPVLRNGNFMDLDAAAGITYHYQQNKIGFEAGIAAQQLAGNVITKQLDGMRMLPHVDANASLLIEVAPKVNLGPRLFYRNTLGQTKATLRAATTDVGLTTRLGGKGFWLAGSYRIDQSAFNVATGIRVARSDTAPRVEGFANFIDINFGYTHPLQEVSLFGPTLEVGVAWTFGKRKFIREKPTVLARNFWKSDDWMTEFRVKYLDQNAPANLFAKSYITPKAIYLDFSFPDISRRYIGDSPIDKMDSLLYRIGMEWEGVDGLLENLASKVVDECLNPDTLDKIVTEDLEPLRHLARVELSAKLRGDEEAVHFGSGIEYAGELGTNNLNEDTLFIDVVFNDKDTTLAVRPGAMTSKLELAALKLHAMGKKIEYELRYLYQDTKFNILWEGEEVGEDESLPVVRMAKPRIIPNNPQMQFFQENMVSLKVLRFRRYWSNRSDSQEKDRQFTPSEEEKLGEDVDQIELHQND